MTKRPRKPLTPLEAALKKRGRRWGSENAARLRAMRDELATLKEHPNKLARIMANAYGNRSSLSNGAYRRSHWRGADL